jgi:hypothetical protein
MGKFSNISIVASFFGLWIVSFFSNKIQIILGFSLIFTFGILHGANDLLLIEKNKDQKKTYNFIKSLTNYVLVIILCALLYFWVRPVFNNSLQCLFRLISRTVDVIHFN